MKRTAKLLFLPVLFFLTNLTLGQDFLKSGSIHGNFQTDIQFYQEDSAIGAPDVAEDILMNSFANITYSNGSFTAGVRYEAYLNPIQGFDPRYKGTGVPYRFVTYQSDDFEITVGNFYEQFGTGLILRAYEERNLGYDNAFDGIRVKYNPFRGVRLKALIGKQRNFWEKSQGIVRAADAEINLNDAFTGLQESKTHLTIGGSIVSKFQADEDPIYILPENVAAMSARAILNRGSFSMIGEYACKINDPSAVNNFIYKNGEALYFTTSYVQKGFSFSFSGKRVDNMNFRSERSATANSLLINFIPELSKLHAYSLSSIYPYATQLNGEIGFEVELAYAIPKNTLLGGKYGTYITIDYSHMNNIDRQAPEDTSGIGLSGTLGYESDFFKFGDEEYFRDFNVEIRKKVSKNFKMVLSWVNLEYDIAVIEGHVGEPKVFANIGIADLTYKLSRKKTLRMELQHLSTEQDDGDWAMMMLEYSIAPKWFFSVMDQYNYGNPESDKQFHYYTASLAYNMNTSSIRLSYGRQREGVICVGGICRVVPASNGLSLTITSSF